jgi:cell division protein FtsB
MRRRRTSRFHFPNIHIPGIKLPKVNLPKVDLPKLDLPQIKLPKFTLPVRQILVVAVMAVLVLTMMNLNTRLTDYYRLTSERDTIAQQVDQLKTTRQILETQMAYAQSNQAVEEFARDSHMIREGEKLVVVLTPQDNNLVSTPESPIPTPKPVENWEVWWALFFGN